jgi:hypothetical protein
MKGFFMKKLGVTNDVKKVIYIFLILCIAMTFSGCALFRNPLKSWDKAENKVTIAEKKIDTNQDRLVEQGKNYVYATKLVLQTDPSTNKHHEIETQLNDKALAIFGPPPMEDINQLDLMVRNLLSDNEKLVKQGQQQLASFDATVVQLQNENTKLQNKLDVAQKKLQDVGTSNSGLAQKWSLVVKIFWWIIYAIIFIAIIKILAVVLPPPYNSIVGIVAVPIGLMVKMVQSLIPEVKAAAGVVHQNYQIATEDLVTIIQKLKESHPELRAEISKTVYSETDSTTSAQAINDTKAKLGIVG